MGLDIYVQLDKKINTDQEVDIYFCRHYTLMDLFETLYEKKPEREKIYDDYVAEQEMFLNMEDINEIEKQVLNGTVFHRDIMGENRKILEFITKARISLNIGNKVSMGWFR